MAHSKKYNPKQSVPKKDSVANTLDKDFIKHKSPEVLKELRIDMEKFMTMMCEQNGNVSKEIDSLKRNQKNILKSTIIEMKSSQEGVRGTFEQTEERSHELQDMTMEILKSEEQKEKH